MKNIIEKFSKLSKQFAQCKARGQLHAAQQLSGWFYTRVLERGTFLSLKTINENYNATMDLDSHINDFKWQKSKILTAKNNIDYTVFSLEIFSDASITVLGAVCYHKKANGHWDSYEKEMSINLLELNVAFFGQKCFAKESRFCDILLRKDNTTSLAYINRMGGIQFEHLNQITREIWRWCEKRNIYIFP